MAFDLDEHEGGLTKGQKYLAYSRFADPIIAFLAFAFLVVWSLRIAARDALPGSVRATLLTLQGLIWLVFIVDMIVRVVFHESRFRFLLTHPLDVVSVVIPAARPLKLLSVFGSGTMLASRNGAVKSTQAVIISVGLLIWISSVAILEAERGHPDAQIANFGDAVWWSLVTMTTVGYGDFSPVTVQGRIIATIVMFIGIALLGVVTASVAAWFVSLTQGAEDAKDDAREEAREEVTRTQLLNRIAELESKIDQIAAREGPGASGLPHQTPKAAPRAKGARASRTKPAPPDTE